MSSKPVAWFRKVRNMWYTTIDGKQISLGVKGEKGGDAASEALEKLLATLVPSIQRTTLMPLKATVDSFLARTKDRIKPHTFRVYQQFLGKLVKHFGEQTDIHSLTAPQVEKSAERSTWSKSTRHGYLGTVGMFLKDVGHPLRLRRPAKESRGADSIWTQKEFWQVYGAARGDLKPLLLILLHCGCRPGEATGMTVQGIDWEHQAYRPKDHKNAHKGKTRVIHFTEEAMIALRGQRLKYADGFLFRQEDDKPFNVHSLCDRVIAARERAGITRPVTAYGLRHGWCTRALETGLSNEQVAALVGNSAAMIEKHYSHIDANAQLLKELAAKVRLA
jgi:integrase